MTDFLSKTLDLLKASGWQTGMIALSAALFLYLSKAEVLPPMEPWMIPAAWGILFVSGALAAASLGNAIQQGILAGLAWWKRRRALQKIKQRFIDDIPTLTEHERRILGYLRHYRQKTLVGDVDGGYASTLIAKGYLYMIAAPGQRFGYDKIPYAVAEHVWKVINERPQDFPHQPVFNPDDRRVEMYPWRIPWMLR